MRRFLLAVAVCMSFIPTANAQPRHHKHHHQKVMQPQDCFLGLCEIPTQTKRVINKTTRAIARFARDPRPRAWCGWWMRQRYHVADRSYNLARKWAHFGSAASGPCEGCIGVQPHHVFEVVRVVGPGKVLAISGNDGRAVRTRVRSTHRVIAWRRPHISLAMQ